MRDREGRTSEAIVNLLRIVKKRWEFLFLHCGVKAHVSVFIFFFLFFLFTRLKAALEMEEKLFLNEDSLAGSRELDLNTYEVGKLFKLYANGCFMDDCK